MSQTSTLLFKRKCFDKIGGFDLDFTSRQEFDVCIRIAKYFEFEFIKEIVGLFYIHGDQITSNIDKKIKGVLQFIKKYQNDLIKYSNKYASNLSYLAVLFFYKKKKKTAIRILIYSLKFRFNIKSLLILILIIVIPRLFKLMYEKRTELGKILSL